MPTNYQVVFEKIKQVWTFSRVRHYLSFHSHIQFTVQQGKRGSHSYSSLPFSPVLTHSDIWLALFYPRCPRRVFNWGVCNHQTVSEWDLPISGNLIWLNVNYISLLDCKLYIITFSQTNSGFELASTTHRFYEHKE